MASMRAWLDEPSVFEMKARCWAASRIWASAARYSSGFVTVTIPALSTWARFLHLFENNFRLFVLRSYRGVRRRALSALQANPPKDDRYPSGPRRTRTHRP